ncbi:MAG: hypothetical protein AB7G13_30960 [Lautropia sp.]
MSATLELSDDPVELTQELTALQIGDGLPVVPATPERVARMLDALDAAPDETIGWMPPTWGQVTARFIAINAVLAGCAPEHMPVLVAATRAMLDPAFNLYGIQATTNPVTPLLVVHGPITRRLQMNAKAGAFGPGNYANAVLGRAIRLILTNLGGAIPGETDRATQGQAAKYTFCVAENAEDTPWRPFHARRGLQPDDDAVTVFGIQAQHNIIDVTAANGFELMQVLAGGMAVVATNNVTHGGEALLVISPEHARQIHESGFDPVSAGQFLYEHARIDMHRFPPRLVEHLRTRRPIWVDMAHLPIVDRHEDMQILVIGGPGIQAQFLPSFGATRAITERIVGARRS